MEISLFQARASVRKFKADALPQEMVDGLLQAAIEAPSAGHCQPWHFYAVRSDDVKKQLCTYAYNQKFIAAAPLVIVVCAEPGKSAERYAKRGETLYCLQDTAAAVENILLCAAQNGLGACWCGAFDEEKVSQVLSLPGGLRPVAIIPIGYPAKAAEKPARRPLAEVVTFVD